MAARDARGARPDDQAAPLRPRGSDNIVPRRDDLRTIFALGFEF